MALVGKDEVLRLCYDAKGLDWKDTSTLRKMSFLEKEHARAVQHDWKRADALSLLAANINRALEIAEA